MNEELDTYEELDSYEGFDADENDYDNDYLPTPADTNSSISKVMQSTESILGIARDFKQMNVAMHQMDVNFNTFVAQLDYNLHKFQGNAPIVREQLNRINDRMDLLMNKVMEMDPTTDQEYDYKLRMLDSIDSYSDKLSTLMIKLLES